MTDGPERVYTSAVPLVLDARRRRRRTRGFGKSLCILLWGFGIVVGIVVVVVVVVIFVIFVIFVIVIHVFFHVIFRVFHFARGCRRRLARAHHRLRQLGLPFQLSLPPEQLQLG